QAGIITGRRGGAVTDCVFCRIIARESAADIEYEDDAVVAFRDIYPKAPVHLLIAPRRHIPSIMAMEASDAEALGRCFLAAKALGEGTGFAERGYGRRVYCGAAGGRAASHAT